MEKIHFRAITCLSFLQAQQYGGREKQEHNDIVKFSSLKGKAAHRLLTECCVAIYEYFINVGLGPLIQFRLPISTLHLSVVISFYSSVMSSFIPTGWFLYVSPFLPSCSFSWYFDACKFLYPHPAMEGAPCQESLRTPWGRSPREILILITVNIFLTWPVMLLLLLANTLVS